MPRTLTGSSRRLALLPLLLLTFAEPAIAADEFDYTYVEIAYAVDSTVEAFGRSFDSDDSFRLHGSYRLRPHLFATARYDSAGYDFEDHADFDLKTYSVGLGYDARIGSGDSLPVDWFVVISCERNETHSQLADVDYDVGRNGIGFMAGIHAAVTDHLDLVFNAYEQSFGEDMLLLNGDLNGLSFELGGTLQLQDHCRLTASYRTGELDYLTLANYPSEYNLELDRDELFLGLRYTFR